MGETTPVSLLELNRRIKVLLSNAAVQRCWVIAELSDVYVKGGHCYMELIQKNESGTQILARNRAIIWANVFAKLKAQFEQETGQQIVSGIKLMVEVSVNYHEQFGLSLVITNINSEYTLGDMARVRREILKKLADDGIINMNKELPWIDVPQRIAIISAPSAAGYGDFMNQLTNNSFGLKFYTCLFSASMQGVNTAPSIISALDRINDNLELFDCVVIIRGGGATSDLHSFDDYNLAAYVAQFPLPVIVGIGHERDVTVLDYVAAMRVKTPTAAAEWLIEQGENALAHVNDLSEQVVKLAKDYMSHAKEQLAYYASTIPLTARNIISSNKSQLNHYMQAIPLCANNRITTAQAKLQFVGQSIGQAAKQRIMRENMLLKSLEEKVEILSPQNTLNRGYSLTTCNGKAVVDATQLKLGDRVTTRFAKGTVDSIIS